MRRMSRWGMICCLTLEWLALGIWVGGLLVLIGAVIPAVFNTFGGQDIGGLFLTQVFEGYNHFVIGAVTILCATAWYRWWSGDQVVAVSRGELALLAGMVLIAGVIIIVLHPYATALQAQAFAVKEEAARKAAFEALFRVLLPVRLIYMVNLAMGIFLIGIRANLSLLREKVSP